MRKQPVQVEKNWHEICDEVRKEIYDFLEVAVEIIENDGKAN